MGKGTIGAELAKLGREIDLQQALTQERLTREKWGWPGERGQAVARSVLLDEAGLRLAMGTLAESRGDFHDARQQLRAALRIVAEAFSPDRA